MKNTIKLFLKFHFTSLSPYAQPISLAVVSEDMKPCDFPNEYPIDELVSRSDYKRKSFYAEFSDFSIDRCDDWVKENVVSKLKQTGQEASLDNFNYSVWSDTERIKFYLKRWLEQFKDYDIQFVVDCSYLSSMWIVELLDKRLPSFPPPGFLIPVECIPPNKTIDDIQEELRRGDLISIDKYELQEITQKQFKAGLPILPSNISPITEDLNQIIAREKGISIREAFELDRSNPLDMGLHQNYAMDRDIFLLNNPIFAEEDKGNALWDAKVIKTIYNKLR